MILVPDRVDVIDVVFSDCSYGGGGGYGHLRSSSRSGDVAQGKDGSLADGPDLTHRGSRRPWGVVKRKCDRARSE